MQIPTLIDHSLNTRGALYAEHDPIALERDLVVRKFHGDRAGRLIHLIDHYLAGALDTPVNAPTSLPTLFDEPVNESTRLTGSVHPGKNLDSTTLTTMEVETVKSQLGAWVALFADA